MQAIVGHTAQDLVSAAIPMGMISGFWHGSKASVRTGSTTLTAKVALLLVVSPWGKSAVHGM